MITKAALTGGTDARPTHVVGAREDNEMHVHETEVRYRMERLAAEADLARLARVASGAPAAHHPGRARRMVGHLFISIGSAMQGAAPCPDEQTGAARA